MKRKTIVTVFFTLTALLLSGGKAEGQQQETLARSSSPTARYAAEETGLPAAAPWTLQECIRYAQENNIEIQRQELSIEDAELARKQTRLNYIPSVSASVGSGTSFGRVLDPTTYEFRENSSNTDLSASLSLGTEVFAGMRKYHQLKKSDLALQDMLLQVDKARNDLSLNITAAYLDVLFAEEKVTIASQRTRTLTLQVEQTQMLVESGRKTMGDLLQLQADLADAQFQDIEAKNNRTLAYFTLCQLLEIDDYETFRILIPESMPVSRDGVAVGPGEIYEMAQELPQVKSAGLAMDMADRDISIANITDDGEHISLLDFGLARYTDPEGGFLPSLDFPYVGNVLLYLLCSGYKGDRKKPWHEVLPLTSAQKHCLLRMVELEEPFHDTKEAAEAFHSSFFPHGGNFSKEHFLF